MRRISIVAGALLAALALGSAVAPAAGAAVLPKLECVYKYSDTSYYAVWGYENTGTSTVEIAVGTNNRFDPTPEGRGQPTRFEVGRKTNVFYVGFDGSNLAWVINGTAVTANKSSTSCNTSSVPQGNDSPQAVGIIAAAAGVMVVGGGASGWMLQRRRRRTA
ncbi:MAG TPA: hypothetical protein VIH82_08270 [Acidimicrobiia bacterium]|jgi:hypothetical protein